MTPLFEREESGVTAAFLTLMLQLFVLAPHRA
jgi:hypothetical protein